MAQIIMDHVEKSYAGGVKAINDLSLDIADGEFMVFVGPSGCGKSTALRSIAGLEEITAGTISIGDRIVNDLPPKDRDIAMVFQNYALYPHMTVYDNMAFGLKMRKFPKTEIAKRVGEAAEILGIQELLKRKPRQLSGGQRQRVAVGRAIVRHPQVFLFDEPLSNLDAKLRVQMRVELKRLHDRLETTAIYVTHDQVEAMTLGDRVVVMKDGWIQQVGEPLELYGHPANRFVAGFIGSPSRLPGRHPQSERRRERGPLGGYAGAPGESAAGERGPARAVQGAARDPGHPSGGPARRDRGRRGGLQLRHGRRGRRAARLGDPARPQGRTERDRGPRRSHRARQAPGQDAAVAPS